MLQPGCHDCIAEAAVPLPRRKKSDFCSVKATFVRRRLDPFIALAPEIRFSSSHPYKHSKDDEEWRQTLRCDSSATSSHSRILLCIQLGIPKNNMFAALVVHLSSLSRANTNYSTHVYPEKVSRRRTDSGHVGSSRNTSVRNNTRHFAHWLTITFDDHMMIRATKRKR